MKFLSLSALAFASQIVSIHCAPAVPSPIPSSTAADVPSLVKRASPWPTHLPNNWVAFSQDGGAYGGPVVSAMITIGLAAGDKTNRLLDAFENSSVNLVANYGYDTWFSLAHRAGLQTSMAVVKVSGYFDYEWLSDAAGTSKYLTVMLRFNLLQGTSASIAPTVARYLADYWHIAYIEANYNPKRISQKRDEHDVSWNDKFSFNETEAAQIEKRADQCFHKYSIDTNTKVDRYGGYVPRSTSCEYYA